ncbi:hypothetical protein B0H14DRAFT_2583599 [Mycena olivaceomarginata]|nr:hypothetical protein B0H14DRAFT_2583599 [Mycena olivaceomarginata]
MIECTGTAFHAGSRRECRPSTIAALINDGDCDPICGIGILRQSSGCWVGWGLMLRQDGPHISHSDDDEMGRDLVHTVNRVPLQNWLCLDHSFTHSANYEELFKQTWRVCLGLHPESNYRNILSDQARQQDDYRRMPMPQVGSQTPSSINTAMVFQTPHTTQTYSTHFSCTLMDRNSPLKARNYPIRPHYPELGSDDFAMEADAATTVGATSSPPDPHFRDVYLPDNVSFLDLAQEDFGDSDEDADYGANSRAPKLKSLVPLGVIRVWSRD